MIIGDDLTPFPMPFSASDWDRARGGGIELFLPTVKTVGYYRKLMLLYVQYKELSF
jgi:hypothetical protein